MPSLVTMLRALRCLAMGLQQVACGSALAGVLLLPLVAWADKPQWVYQTFPFAQRLNMEAVYEVTHSPPQRLIETIRRWGVDIQLVHSEAPVLPLNPLLTDLPPATPELVRRADFRDTYDGLVVHGGSQTCGLSRNTILIRDTALSYTLIHEFVQSLLQPLCAGEPDDSVEVRFGAAFRRLVIYQRRLYHDPSKLLNPLWRRDILAAQADVAQDLFDRIRLGQSQEAIVEKVLSIYIDERNPFFDAARRAQGLQFGELMINNAIDIFNALNESVAFVDGMVRNLGRSLRDGDTKPGEGIALTEDDEALVARSVWDVATRLAVVRTELQVLKQFFSR